MLELIIKFLVLKVYIFLRNKELYSLRIMYFHSLTHKTYIYYHLNTNKSNSYIPFCINAKYYYKKINETWHFKSFLETRQSEKVRYQGSIDFNYWNVSHVRKNENYFILKKLYLKLLCFPLLSVIEVEVFFFL